MYQKTIVVSTLQLSTFYDGTRRKLRARVFGCFIYKGIFI